MATSSKPLTPKQIQGIKDAVERRKAIDKWLEQQKPRNVDGAVPKPVSPPAGRVVPNTKRSKPIIRGGKVTGKREPYGTA